MMANERWPGEFKPPALEHVCAEFGHQWQYTQDSAGEGLFRHDLSYRRCTVCELEERHPYPRLAAEIIDD
jgi:hypothetical protein